MIYADAMKTLFLDLASHDALIACVDDQKVIASESVHARIGDHELIPMTEKVLAEAKWTFEDLEGIACVIGPGGFTSLRVAVTFGNVLADQLKIPSVGIHLSVLYRARVESGKRKVENEFWLHSTKKDQLFVQGGDFVEPTLISLDDFSALCTLHSPLSWMGELIDAHREKINTDHVELQSVIDVLPIFLASQNFDAKLLTPWYGRGW